MQLYHLTPGLVLTLQFRTCMPVCMPDLVSPPLSPTSPTEQTLLLPHWREPGKREEKKKDLNLVEALGTANFW